MAIWNAGNTPIRTENILDPVTIVIPGAVILEATIRKVSRPLVKLEMNSGEAQKGKLQLSWAILEHADGAVIQIIYSGKPGALMIIEGTVEGQGRLAIELHDRTGPKPIAFLLFLGFGMFASGLLPFIFKRPRSSWDIVSDVVYLMFAVSVLALGFWVVWQNHLHAMPTFVLES